MEKKGIKCVPFNRINPIIGIIMNHRDHRKIMVIDGKVAFSGGVNLADEYINRKEKFGHWKDNVIRIQGDAVWSYTVMFLTHWNALRREDEDFRKYKVSGTFREADGYICPYGETPLNNEITAQNIYMGILNQANQYCYIMTPGVPDAKADFLSTLEKCREITAQESRNGILKEMFLSMLRIFAPLL